MTTEMAERTIPYFDVLDPAMAPTRVRCHRNLNGKGPEGEDIWSVVDPRTGLVLAHTAHLSLADVTMIVRPGGRDRVLAEKQKNVHAFIAGRPVPYAGTLSRSVTYNPYEAAYFYDKDTRLPIWSAARVTLDQSGATFE